MRTYCIQHKELYSMLCGHLNGEEILKRVKLSTDRWVAIDMVHIYNGEGNGTPLQYSCLENPMDRGAW